MGVLEARKDAEKVGFPVVGEEKKDPSNVVDYDIHEEITIDTSSVFNANNDTTTGMATVIPGVNAPKLIASTSIIGDLGGGGGGSFSYSEIKWKTTTRATAQNFAIFDKVIGSSLSSDLTLDDYRIVCPNGGTYLIQVSLNTTNVNASFDASMISYDGDVNYIVEWSGSGGIAVGASAVAKITAGSWLRCGLNPTYNCRPELTAKFLKLM